MKAPCRGGQEGVGPGKEQRAEEELLDRMGTRENVGFRGPLKACGGLHVGPTGCWRMAVLKRPDACCMNPGFVSELTYGCL